MIARTPTHTCQYPGCGATCHRLYCPAHSYQAKKENARTQQRSPEQAARKKATDAAWKRNNVERNRELAREGYHRRKARKAAPVVVKPAQIVLDMSIKDPIERVVDLARRKAMAAGDPHAEYIR